MFNVMKTYKNAGERNRRIVQTYFKPYHENQQEKVKLKYVANSYLDIVQ